jgi:cobalamin biosynthetic protein CobC
MIAHGGNLLAVCQQTATHPSDWLDLSTGISPWSYPLPPVPDAVWQRLPEAHDGLETVATDYYGVDESELLPVAGSQWAIEQIPLLYTAPLRVGMLSGGYAEHPAAWQAAGHAVIFYDSYAELIVNAPALDAMVFILPHNPFGVVLSELEAQWLMGSNYLGIIVIDEAFADASTVPRLPIRTKWWRLRSVGKFFGLAGIRLGFVLSTPEQIEQLRHKQSPWSVNHVARWAGQWALADTKWQRQQRLRLSDARQRLENRLSLLPAQVMGVTDYFMTLATPQAEAWYQQALKQQLLIRYFPDQNWLRLGLPKTEADWLRLERWVQAVLCPR